MSFQEKSTWITVVTVLFVYGQYFLNLTLQTPWALESTTAVEYRVLMFGTVVTLVIVMAVSHIVIAMFAPEASDQIDERDREINRKGEYIGGYVVGAAALTGMGMAMFETEHFWIANLLLLGLVLSEIVAGCIKLYIYRRGF